MHRGDMEFKRPSRCKWDKDFDCAEVGGLDSPWITIRSTVTKREVSFTREEWASLVDGMKRGEFDLQHEVDLDREDQLEQV